MGYQFKKVSGLIISLYISFLPSAYQLCWMIAPIEWGGKYCSLTYVQGNPLQEGYCIIIFLLLIFLNTSKYNIHSRWLRALVIPGFTLVMVANQPCISNMALIHYCLLSCTSCLSSKIFKTVESEQTLFGWSTQTHKSLYVKPLACTLELIFIWALSWFPKFSWRLWFESLVRDELSLL